MNLNKFKEVIQETKKYSTFLDNLHNLGVNVWDSCLGDYGFKMFDLWANCYFNSEGVDWIQWWLYEKDTNSELKAYDKDDAEIPTETIEDLWNIVKEYLK